MRGKKKLHTHKKCVAAHNKYYVEVKGLRRGGSRAPNTTGEKTPFCLRIGLSACVFSPSVSPRSNAPRVARSLPAFGACVSLRALSGFRGLPPVPACRVRSLGSIRQRRGRGAGRGGYSRRCSPWRGSRQKAVAGRGAWTSLCGSARAAPRPRSPAPPSPPAPKYLTPPTHPFMCYSCRCALFFIPLRKSRF